MKWIKEKFSKCLRNGVYTKESVQYATHQRGKKQIIDDKEKAEKLNECIALAFTGKAGSNKALKAVVYNKGRKRSQNRIRIDQVKEC